MTTAAAHDPPKASGAPTAWILAAFGFLVRIATALWGASRFPPTEDGHFYHVVAGRIARGLGYTWQWPDGAVTYAAHYPVGYPAIVGLGYALFGEHPLVAMVENAMLGALAVRAVYGIAETTGSRRAAMASAIVCAIHPGLVFYVPALMTEGAASSLIVIGAWLALRAHGSGGTTARAVTSGLVLGVATLVRPQSLLFAPAFGVLAGTSWKSRLRSGVVAMAVALLSCAPWTVRNCNRMHSCALVSVNAGWNLFIGAAPGATGTFVPLDVLGVPPECKTVWDEAQKDGCFGRAGRAAVLAEPWRYLSLVPRKLALTFDYAGAAGWYLHASNGAAFTERAKVALGSVETVFERLVVLAALLAAGFAEGARARGRRALSLVSVVFLFSRSAWVGHVGLVLCAALFGKRAVERPAVFVAAATVFGTALVHAVFFGAGRYSLVCFPALSALSGAVLTLSRRASDTD